MSRFIIIYLNVDEKKLEITIFWARVDVVLWSMLAIICGRESMLLHLLRTAGLVLSLELFLSTRFPSFFLCLHV
jgi:hypothetical protein